MADGEDGVVDNYQPIEGLAIPTKLIRMRGWDFLLYDSGGGDDRILLFGADPIMRAIRPAPVWVSDGAFKVRPGLWAKVYTPREVAFGYCAPCIYANLPGESQGAYSAMWGQARALAGEGADGGRLLTVDFARESINAFDGKFSHPAVAGCYFRLCLSVFRRVQILGRAGEFWAGDGFKLLPGTVPALALRPLELATQRYGRRDEAFQGDEMELLAYIDAAYIGRRGHVDSRRPSASMNGGARSRVCCQVS